MINKVILVGNLGKDPETKTVAGGMVVTNFNLATTDRRKDRDGNWQDQTEWHRLVCFGKTAEFVGTYLKKGRQAYIEGKIQTRKYTDKDGVEKWSTEILCDVVRGLGPKPADASGGGESYSGKGADDDIPF